MTTSVLIVEDEPEFLRRFTNAVLMDSDLVLAGTAGTGRAALAMLEAEPPDVVLLDLGLPDVSGYEVARELRRRAGRRPLHIAAVTGSSHPDDRARTHAAGFDQHLVKPADAAKLRHVLYIADLRARSA